MEEEFKEGDILVFWPTDKRNYAAIPGAQAIVKKSMSPHSKYVDVDWIDDKSNGQHNGEYIKDEFKKIYSTRITEEKKENTLTLDDVEIGDILYYSCTKKDFGKSTPGIGAKVLVIDKYDEFIKIKWLDDLSEKRQKTERDGSYFPARFSKTNPLVKGIVDSNFGANTDLSQDKIREELKKIVKKVEQFPELLEIFNNMADSYIEGYNRRNKN